MSATSRTGSAMSARTSYHPVSRRRARQNQQIIAYLFLLPAVIVFALFAWLPIVKAIEMSFYDVSMNGDAIWRGLKNYELMFKDPAFGIAWRNSFEFAGWSIALGFIVPIGVALFVREMRFAQGFFRIVYFLPSVVPSAIAVIIWRFFYDPDGGFLNEAIKLFGSEGMMWLTDASLVKPSLIMMMTWGSFGSTALIYLSSLQEIPTELYEAAELDGAGPMGRVRFITLPHLFPVISTLFILQVLAVVQVFTEPFLMTNGGPGRETLTPALNIYNRAFIRGDLGYAATWSVSMIVVLLVFSIIYRVVNSKLNPE